MAGFQLPTRPGTPVTQPKVSGGGTASSGIMYNRWGEPSQVHDIEKNIWVDQPTQPRTEWGQPLQNFQAMQGLSSYSSGAAPQAPQAPQLSGYGGGNMGVPPMPQMSAYNPPLPQRQPFQQQSIPLPQRQQAQQIAPPPEPTGAGALPPERLAPPDTSEAEKATFNRAKDQQGLITRSALSGLQGSLAGRGMLGSGLEGRETGKIVQQGAGELGNLSREQAIQHAALGQKNAEAAFAGGITQRGQDISAQQNQQQQALNRWQAGQQAQQAANQLATQQYGQEQQGYGQQQQAQQAAAQLATTQYGQDLQGYGLQQNNLQSQQDAALRQWEAGNRAQQSQQEFGLKANQSQNDMAMQQYQAQLQQWQAQQQAQAQAQRQQQQAVSGLAAPSGYSSPYPNAGYPTQRNY